MTLVGADVVDVIYSTIRMCPPLIVTEKDIDVVLKVLDDALTEDVA